jgi:hypothetical protein
MNKNKFNYCIKINHKDRVNHTSYQLKACYHSASDKLNQELTNKETDKT